MRYSCGELADGIHLLRLATWLFHLPPPESPEPHHSFIIVMARAISALNFVSLIRVASKIVVMIRPMCFLFSMDKGSALPAYGFSSDTSARVRTATKQDATPSLGESLIYGLRSPPLEVVAGVLDSAVGTQHPTTNDNVRDRKSSGFPIATNCLTWLG